MYPIDPRTTVQEHFNSGRETIDTGLDSLKSLLVRGRIVAPSEHRQAVLNETMHQIVSYNVLSYVRYRMGSNERLLDQL